jgi:UDP-2,3-diacylglucosamine pyrophosphatase LpxH
MKEKKRQLEICVISDTHLGSRGTRIDELNSYIKSINPKILILNGDIFEGINFRKSYFPPSHFLFVKNIINLVKEGTIVYLLSGNHDDFLRKFDDFSIQNLHKLDKLVLEVDGYKYWFFHGDIFDISMRGKFGKWISKVGGNAYDLIIVFNRWYNRVLKIFGRPPYSLSKMIKDSVKKAVIYINDFEELSCQHAIKQGYDYVVNGHIHNPTIREYKLGNKSVIYMNSGDWIENLSALEYNKGEWKLFFYK